MNQKSLLSSFLLVLLMLSVGCAKKPNDTQISSDIQNKFSQDSGLSSKQLSVQSANGIVTLGGNVDNDAQREAAARQAASVAGVKEIINNLQVGNATAAATPPQSLATQPSNSSAPDRSKPGAGKSSRKSQGGDSAMADKSQPSSQAADSGQMDAANNPPPSPAAPADATPPPPPPPPAPKKFIIDQGTQMTVRLMDPIDSEKNQTGDTFHATLNAPLILRRRRSGTRGRRTHGPPRVEVKSARQVRRTVRGRHAARQPDFRWPDLQLADRSVQENRCLAWQKHR